VKILLDTCVWGGAKHALAKAGHDVVWVADWEEDPGDEQVLATAYREGRVLTTLDKDFGELAIVYDQPHAGIIRLVGFAAQQQAVVCLDILDRFARDLESQAIITAEPGRIRVRTAPRD
jgi:predicted nuclease of predicted toxin-antitoxin system